MSYGAVAWYGDVDRALMKEIKECVKVPSKRSGSLVELEDSHIVVMKPEEDYKIEVYPSVSIYNISTTHNAQRYQYADKYDVTLDHENAQMSYRKPNVTFDLKYQIDFWAKFQSDMNTMVQTWLVDHFRQFNLDIESDSGYSCNVLQEGTITKSDLLEDNKRIFHSIINYVIWVEIEDERVYNKPIVEGVTINTHEKS